ncbi:transposase (plasmid) [Trichormus variabilis NIES-23]|uniref:Transposase n=1 Tax=Trichormus variabilis NIES-23 TaxID=1973479 RepID=A0A1Z4KWF6_ANAVA|nr:transposase [Trichormus variabilis NIES-23]
MWNEYNNPRHIRTLNGVVELQLKIRRCQNKSCMRYKKAYRPEQEGSLALPQNEFGLDVIAYIGALRYQEHRSVPQIHTHLELKGICISQRTVTHLIDRYDELLSFERSVTNETQEMVTIIEDYCSAVRSSITNDGHPPLEASGLKLQENLTLIEQSLDRMEKKVFYHRL